MNEIISKLKTNPEPIYWFLSIIGLLYTAFKVVFTKFKKSKFANLLKLITEVPETIRLIKEDQREIYSEIKLQSKVINAILDTLELAQFLCDHDGKCIKVNSKWISLTGLSEEDALGNNWLLSVHSNDRDRVHEKWNDMVENKSPFEETFRYHHRVTGIITKVKCTATDVIDENNNRLYILGLSRVL
jgi:PAS domain S-box-containing protein